MLNEPVEEACLYKLIGKSRDGLETSGVLTASSAIEANATHTGLMRDGHFTVTIIAPDGRELSDAEFYETVKAERKVTL